MNKHALALAGLVLASIIAAVVLTFTHHPVPEWCGAVILGGVGALGGLALPSGESVAQLVATELHKLPAASGVVGQLEKTAADLSATALAASPLPEPSPPPVEATP